MTGLDLGRAAAFLEKSRSAFLREAGRWLVELDDPGEVLLLLSGDVGQHLGPWDTFRHCALLGLHHASSVQSLALDVLSEDVPASKEPPIAPALAVAWAKDRYPEEAAPQALAMREALTARGGHPRGHPVLEAAAVLALAGPAGAAADRELAERSVDDLRAALAGPEGPKTAGPVLEGAVLGGDPGLIEEGIAAVGRSQLADGGVQALTDNALLRGFSTMRALALCKRLEADAARGR